MGLFLAEKYKKNTREERGGGVVVVVFPQPSAAKNGRSQALIALLLADFVDYAEVVQSNRTENSIFVSALD